MVCSTSFLAREYDIIESFLFGACADAFLESSDLIKRPARDACLCMGELQAPPAPPAPHFVFLITL